jgi:hypothetical protein
MSARSAVPLLVVLGTIAGLSGCGSQATLSPIPPPAKPTSVLFVAPPPTSLAVNASATIDASAIYPTSIGNGSSLVTYTMSCGTPSACGTFSANDELGATTYTAPAAIPSGATVTVTATSVADTTKSASASITIVAPIPISVSFFAPPPASLEVNTTATLNAVIANDVSANPEVKWTVTCSASACGSFSPTTTTSEQGAVYTAPASIPSGGSVTVTATSITDSTKSVSASILVTAVTPTLANGTYVFQLSGSPGSQANFMTGVFTAANGAITGGEQDWIYYYPDSNGDLSSFQQISGGNYGVTSDGNLQVSLQIGAGQVETFNGTLASGGKGFVAALNGFPASGTLDLQTSIAAPSGGYAISLSGGDEDAGSAWISGILNIDSPGAISGSGSILDVIDSEFGYTGAQSLGASTVSAPDANGRVQIQLVAGAGSILPPVSLAGYVIDAAHMRLIETYDDSSTDNFQGVLGGTAVGQGVSTGKFSDASIAGSSYVFGAQGDDTHGPLQIAGVFTPRADGTLTGTLNWNDQTGNSIQNPIAFTGSYAIDPTGRMTLSNLTDGSTFNYALHLYLAANGSALLLSNDSNDVFVGQAFQQQAAFSAASFSGSFGLNAILFRSDSSYAGPGQATAIGAIVSNADSGADTVSGFADTGNGIADFSIAGAFNPSANGVFEGSLRGFNSASRTTPGNFTLYLVDGAQAILIETDNTQLTLGHLQSQR